MKFTPKTHNPIRKEISEDQPKFILVSQAKNPLSNPQILCLAQFVSKTKVRDSRQPLKSCAQFCSTPRK